MEATKKAGPYFERSAKLGEDHSSFQHEDSKQFRFPFPEDENGVSPYQLKTPFFVSPPRRAVVEDIDFRLADIAKHIAKLDEDDWCPPPDEPSCSLCSPGTCNDDDCPKWKGGSRW